MATFDADHNIIDVTIAVVGADTLSFLTKLGARFGLDAADVAAKPTVPLNLVSASGPKLVFHFSGFESERARADAFVIAGVDGDLPAGHSPVQHGADVMASVKAASRIGIERIRARDLPAMPHTVREGLHRHDRAAAPALAPVGEAGVGQQVKVQLNLRVGGLCLAMTGPVRAVLGSAVVEAEVVATTDRAPSEFDGTWRARLERFEGWQYPWVLTSLARAGVSAQLTT